MSKWSADVLAVAIVCSLISGCGSSTPADQPAQQPTTDAVLDQIGPAPAPAPTDTEFNSANAPGLNVSPQDSYEEAKIVCGLKSAREIAADFDMQTSDPERIVVRYSRGYDDALRPAVAEGCRDGLEAYAKKHPGPQKRDKDPVRLAQLYVLGSDNDAVRIEEAIKDAQDGKQGARSSLLRLDARIAQRTAKYLKAGGTSVIGGKRLRELIANAVAAIDANDAPALVQARVGVFDARRALIADLKNAD